jgi:copper transport protein
MALVAVFQAAGGSLFLWQHGASIAIARPPVRRLVQAAALGGCVLLITDEFLQVARLAGDFGGVLDPDLQRLSWGSRGGIVHAVQIFCLATIMRFVASEKRSTSSIAASGVAVATAAFAGAGHTSVHPLHLLLDPLLAAHAFVGAFWFGALAPLILAIRTEPTRASVRALTQFSRFAGWLVPGLAAAGIAIATVLIPALSVFRRPYGELLGVKIIVYGLLLFVAAYNRWRGTASLAANVPGAKRLLTGSIGLEILLLTVVLTAVAVLTTYFSPDG